MKDCVCKEATIEGLIMQLKLEREGNLVLTNRVSELQDAVWSMIHNPKKWETLDAFELKELYDQDPHWLNYAANIEAKLKEKNGG